jgi:hypothetical protein
VIQQEHIAYARGLARWYQGRHEILDLPECLAEAMSALCEDPNDLSDEGIKRRVHRVLRSLLRTTARIAKHESPLIENEDGEIGTDEYYGTDPFFTASMDPEDEDNLESRHVYHGRRFCAPVVIHVKDGKALTPHGASLLASARKNGIAPYRSACPAAEAA